MKRDDRLWLTEIVTACDEIAAALKRVDRQAFAADIIVQGFVLNRVTIIGEAASKVSSALGQPSRSSMEGSHRNGKHRRASILRIELEDCLGRRYG